MVSCCKDKCSDSSPVKATFTMSQVGYIKTYSVLNGDTIGRYEEVTFKADVEEKEGVSYEWKVGTDSRVFTKRQFKLEFDVNETIKVRLITKKKLNLDCFPLDDGIDTTEQIFTVADSTLIKGEYVGSNKSKPSDVFTVNFIDDRIKFRQYVDNLPKSCIRNDQNWVANQYSASYRVAGIGKTNDTVKDCPGIYGIAELARDNKTITIDYTYWDDSKKQFIKDQFIGIKK